jgi:hypothetical protein
VKLFRPVSLLMKVKSNSLEAVQTADANNFVSNLAEIMTQEYSNIKELTDFESGLRFAIHRLLDLKQLELKYLLNPWYPNNSELSVQDLDKDIRSLVEKLLLLEQSEINTKLYFRTLVEKHEQLLEGWAK